MYQLKFRIDTCHACIVMYEIKFKKIPLTCPQKFFAGPANIFIRNILSLGVIFGIVWIYQSNTAASFILSPRPLFILF